MSVPSPDPSTLLLASISEFAVATERMNAAVRDIVDLANTCDMCPDDARRLLGSRLVASCNGELRAMAAHLECKAELDSAHDGIRRISIGTASTRDFFGGVDDYDQLVTDEMELAAPVLAQLNPEYRIAFVGSGALPVTPVHIHRLTGRRVLAIDHDEKAVEAAKRLLELSNVTEVEVACDEGAHAALDDVGLLHLATMTEGKVAIVAAGLAAGIEHFMVRGGRSLCELFYEGVDVDAIEALGTQLIASTQPGPGIKCQTFLFRAVQPS